MRNEVLGGSVNSQQGVTNNSVVSELENPNKRQKLLPVRVRPPPSHLNNTTTNDGNTLPPRVQKPDIPRSNTSIQTRTPNELNTSNLRNAARHIPNRAIPSMDGERFKELTVFNKRSVTAPSPSSSTSTLTSVSNIRSNLQTFNQIQVSKSQMGNPLLEYLNVYQMNSKIKDVDYVVNSKCVVLFLSLRYHKLHPEYIYNKLKKVTYNLEDTLRVLLLYVDIEDFQDTVRELDKLCLFNKLTLILAWTNEQCATYLQNLKYVEKEASKQIIQGSRTKDEDVIANEGKYLERVMNTVSSIKSVSQSDAKRLLIKYGSVRGIIEANADELPDIQGLGQLKVNRLLKTFNGSFKEFQ
ncbi:ssDNA endonuclease and repair protein rad10 [Pichia californica]|nr:ssDNA endonuclease and repair protein rad10 [[Candida] californica]